MDIIKFYMFPVWLLDTDVSADAKILYMYLYNLSSCTNDEFLYIPANRIEKIFKITEFKRKRVLRELISNNLIKREGRGRNTKTYVLEGEKREVNND